jgi:hypothetical protein
MLSDEDLARIAHLIFESEARITNRFEGKLDAVETRINDRTAQAIEASENRLLLEFR